MLRCDWTRRLAVEDLEQHTRAADVFLLFLTSGYLTSANCRRELLEATRRKLPTIILRESDPQHGGCSLSELQAEADKLTEANCKKQQKWAVDKLLYNLWKQEQLQVSRYPILPATNVLKHSQTTQYTRAGACMHVRSVYSSCCSHRALCTGRTEGTARRAMGAVGHARVQLAP